MSRQQATGSPRPISEPDEAADNAPDAGTADSAPKATGPRVKPPPPLRAASRSVRLPKAAQRTTALPLTAPAKPLPRRERRSWNDQLAGLRF